MILLYLFAGLFGVGAGYTAAAKLGMKWARARLTLVCAKLPDHDEVEELLEPLTKRLKRVEAQVHLLLDASCAPLLPYVPAQDRRT